MKEQQLIEFCLRNDRKAQKELVQQYAPVLLTVARRYSYSAIEPEDILQDSFIQIFTHLNQFDAQRGKIFTWMRQIVINTALKHFRSEKNKINGTVMIEDLHENAHGSESDFSDTIDAEHWIEWINKLPQPYRQIFNLAAIDGYSHEEIAKLLNIEVVTSRSYLHRARKLLLSMIQHSKQLENGKRI